MIPLLLAMQASGMVIDYMGMRSQQQYGEYGLKLQRAGINANIQSLRLQTEDESLNAMINLRKNIGTQMAVAAARGTATGAGSALAIMSESFGNFNKDERMRRMNLLTRENELKAGGRIAQLNQSAANAKMWQGFAGRTLNRLPSSFSGGGSAAFSGSSAGGYGLTTIGG